MAHSASAKKRNRQNLRNRERNRAAKSVLKTSIRKVLTAVSSGDVAGAREQLRATSKTADQAAAKGTIHRNRAARIKSRLSARVRAAGTSPTGQPAAAAKGRKA